MGRGRCSDMTDFTITNLADVDDSAPKFGIGEIQEARFATKALDAEQLGLAYIRLKPDQVSPFAHRHETQEELYVVLSGSGSVVLDEEQRDLRPLDAVRVAPSVARSFTSGPEGLDIVAFGAPALSGGSNDGEIIEPGS